MLRQDLAGYILLGDPAAQLALSRRPAPSAVAAPTVAAASVPTVTTSAAAVAPAAPAAPAAFSTTAAQAAGLGIRTVDGTSAAAFNQEQLESAICQMILGDLPPKKIAIDAEIALSELRRLTEVYRQAGRAALLADRGSGTK
jgi:hypothetical protein